MNANINANVTLADLTDAVKAAALSNGLNVTVESNSVIKNNGTTRNAIFIKRPDSVVTPVSYCDSLIDEINQGKLSLESAADQVLSSVIDNDCSDMDFIADMLTDRKFLLSHVQCQLINMEHNKAKLKEDNIPYLPFLDLAEVYRVYLPKSCCPSNSGKKEAEASVLISKQLMERCDIAFEELIDAARKNTEKAGFRIRPMSEVMQEIFDNAGYSESNAPLEISVDSEGPGMHVMSNKTGCNGANILLFPDVIGELADRLQGDLYILPSSVHEVLGLPVTGMVASDLRNMVRSINEQEVIPEERLSDEVYRFDWQTRRLSIVPEK